MFDVMRQNTAEWLLGVRLRHFSTTCVCSTHRGLYVRVGGCPVIMAYDQWQSTGGSRQVFKFPSNCQPFRFVVPKSIKNFFVPV